MTTDLITKLHGKRKTISQLAKEIKGNNETKIYSARYIRNLIGYSKYGKHTTNEIVYRLRVWYGLNCVFLDGDRIIATCSDGYPVEPIYQHYRIILTPLLRE